MERGQPEPRSGPGGGFSPVAPVGRRGSGSDPAPPNLAQVVLPWGMGTASRGHVGSPRLPPPGKQPVLPPQAAVRAAVVATGRRCSVGTGFAGVFLPLGRGAGAVECVRARCGVTDLLGGRTGPRAGQDPRSDAGVPLPGGETPGGPPCSHLSRKWIGPGRRRSQPGGIPERRFAPPRERTEPENASGASYSIEQIILL